MKKNAMDRSHSQQFYPTAKRSLASPRSAVMLAAVMTLLVTSVFAAGRELAARQSGPAPFVAQEPAIACNSSACLAAWKVESYPDWRIDIARVDSDGRLIDSIAKPLISYVQPGTLRIAALDDTFAIAWTDYSDWSVHVAFVDSDGSLLRTVTPLPSRAFLGAVVSRGNSVLIAAGIVSPIDIAMAVILDAGGDVMTSRSLSADGRAQFPLTATATDDGFAIGFTDRRAIYVQRFDAGLRPSTELIRLGTAPGNIAFSLASDGRDVAAVWNNDSQELAVAFVRADGQFTPGEPLLRTQGFVSGMYLIRTAGKYVAVYIEFSTTVSRRVRAVSFEKGFRDVSAPTLVSNAKEVGLGDVAVLGGRLMAVLSFGLPERQIATATWTPPASTATFELISLYPIQQTSPVIASSGSGFLAVWREAASASTICAIRLDQFGAPIGLGAISLSDSLTTDPAVAFADGVYLVIFNDLVEEGSTLRQRLVAKRVSVDGVVLDDQPLVVRDGLAFRSPLDGPFYGIRTSIASTGKTFLATWTERGVVAAAITPSGWVGSPILISGSPVYRAGESVIYSDPSVAWDGSRFVIAYSETVFSNTTSHPPWPIREQHIEAVALAPDGTPLGPRQNIVPGASGPTLTGGDSRILLTHGELNAAFISGTGGSITISETRRIFEWLPGLRSTAATWTGTDYVLSWRYATWGPAIRSYMGMTRMTPARLSGNLVAVRTGDEQWSLEQSQAIAANKNGQIVFLATEMAGGTNHAVIYLAEDFRPLAPRPVGPLRVDVSQTDFEQLVSWKDTFGEIDGFAVTSNGYPLTSAPPDVLSVDILGGPWTGIHVQAWNAAGFADAVEPATVISPQHRRAK